MHICEEDGLEEQLRAASHSVDELRDEVHVLREAVDELRELLDHVFRCIPPDFWDVLRARRVDSMPLDPTAEDFGAKLNAVPAETLEQLRAATTTPLSETKPTPHDQRQLF